MWRAALTEPKFEEVTLRYLNEGHVAIVTLNRAAKHNAIVFDHLF